MLKISIMRPVHQKFATAEIASDAFESRDPGFFAFPSFAIT